MRPAEELLYDSEASFRLVDHAIQELSGAVALVERLDEAPSLPDDERHAMVGSLREELGGVMNHLQFQDITAQQLKHIESLLADMNRRITQVVKIFAPPAVTFAPDAVTPAPAVLDSSDIDCDDRQAVADEIFAIKAERKTA